MVMNVPVLLPDARADSCVICSDAKRPCATCVRSHRNTVNHAAPGTEIPPLECTFDDVPENGSDAPHPVPKTRLEKLENRISASQIVRYMLLTPY